MSETDAVQAQLEDLKKRVADLEKAEIKLRIQSVGPRGPMGPPGFLGAKGEQGERGYQGETGRAGRDGSDGLTPGKDQIETAVVTLLHEYHVLDPESGLPHAGPYAAKN